MLVGGGHAECYLYEEILGDGVLVFTEQVDQGKGDPRCDRESEPRGGPLGSQDHEE